VLHSVEVMGISLRVGHCMESAVYRYWPELENSRGAPQ